MIFSKSFGYALRGILYIAIMRDQKRYVQVEEIASKLAAPRHFMGKIMKRLAKEKLLISTKGPSGGFILTENTLEKPLMDLIVITDAVEIFDTCVLRAKECSGTNPCPMHSQMESLKSNLKSILSDTTIGDLLKEDKPEFIKSLSTAVGIELPKLSEVQKIY
jgi:Rrf2 family transcriptional regulator, iron-sulfur cluster assembly transcription factor